jgi:flagellar basal-body rod modification protein FlgD
MTTTNATPTTTTSNASTAQAAGAVGSQQLAGNFNTFLTLLTTQLQNQDPRLPFLTNKFSQQLV